MKFKDLKKRTMYEYLAAVDPEAKVLLEELKDFGVSLLTKK